MQDGVGPEEEHEIKAFLEECGNNADQELLELKQSYEGIYVYIAIIAVMFKAVRLRYFLYI